MNKVCPLQSISIEAAKEKQFKFVDCITKNFSGLESLTRGDLGVKKGINKPEYTCKAEKTIADFFDAEDAVLIRGSGTGAIRYALSVILKPGEKLLIHDAPIYPTTEVTINMFGLKTVKADFNNLDEIKKVISENKDIKAALVQIARQRKYDAYDAGEVINTIRQCGNFPIMTDDNYAVMKIDRIGCELGADLSTFSCFKLQGPEGIGCVVGKKEYIEQIKKMHYSGGSQVQGFEAMEVLRGLTYAPVMLAVQAEEADKFLKEVEKGIEGIKEAYIANAQSRVVLVELDKPIAKKVLEYAETLGALPNPVGAESKYELAPMFYKASGTFLKEDPTLIDRMVRINLNRAGANSAIRILKEAMKLALEK